MSEQVFTPSLTVGANFLLASLLDSLHRWKNRQNNPLGFHTITEEIAFNRGEQQPLQSISKTKWRCQCIGLIILLAGATGIHAQHARSELRIDVHDPQGAS